MNSSTAREARYKGVLDAVVAILRREGLAAFFKVCAGEGGRGWLAETWGREGHGRGRGVLESCVEGYGVGKSSGPAVS